jgi:hypothetical protein
MNKVIKCQDCGEDFIFTERDQEFYAEKGFAEPKRCHFCRKARKERHIKKENY